MDLAPERIGGDTFLRPRGVSVRYLGNKSKLLSLLLIALRRQSGRGKHNGMAVGEGEGGEKGAPLLRCPCLPPVTTTSCVGVPVNYSIN